MSAEVSVQDKAAEISAQDKSAGSEISDPDDFNQENSKSSPVKKKSVDSGVPQFAEV